MSKQKRRIEVATGAAGISNNFIDMDFDNSTEVNVHSFRLECKLEPQDMEANANGVWAVWVLPGEVIQNADLPGSFGEFGNEDKFGPYLWGGGVFMASNQTPDTITFTPKTSRNIQRAGRIVFEFRIEGLSAGLLRHNTYMTCYTT